jgi:hypothetical protein
VRQIRGIRVELCTAAVHPPTRKSTAHQIEVSDLPAFGVLGGGVPYLEHVKTAPILLDGPTITEGSRVTHLHYVVRKP